MKSGYGTMFKKRMAVLVIAAWGCQLVASGPLWAAPRGGQVTTGSATIAQSGAITTINQSTTRASINWRSFSTRPQEIVNFNQPSASSLTLNRVIGNERSILEGALNATGKVFLINSNGILFTKGASVNTAGFIASTLNLTDEDFNAGKYEFKANGPTGSIVNMGTITAKDGYVALLGNTVSNQGVISATKGTVALASGDKVTLNFNGDSLINVTVDQGTLNSLVENKEAIYADGGTVILTAKAADDLLSAQVNNTGIIQARTIDDLKGTITLYADGGATTVSGTLDASAPTSGDGGFIETSGDRVKIADGTFITTKSATGKNGTWLIDPTDFTIGEGGDITGTLLSSLLGSSNITLLSTDGTRGTEGDINVNEAVSWSADTTLTLNAATDINVNAPITASGDNAGLTLTAGTDINVNKSITLSGTNGALTMNYGGDYHIFTPTAYAGAVLDANGRPIAQRAPEGTEYASITLPGSNASLTMNGNAYTLIHNMDQLAAQDDAGGTASGFYALAEDLDATAWSAANMGATSVVAMLSGTLAGLGHTVSNLTLKPSTRNRVGLIGRAIEGAAVVIRDIGVVNVNITGVSGVGALLGRSYGGATISNAYSTGTVSGSTASIGGLIGGATDTTIRNSFSDADVTVTDSGQNAGGLVGEAINTTITNSHATGKVTSTSTNTLSNIGGLVGTAVHLTLSNAYTTGNVESTGSRVGGLVGEISIGTVTNSFTTGNVTGTGGTGGLIGHGGGSTIDNCYATGKVTATGGGAGGLVGEGGGTIKNSHATGEVTSTAGYLGGLAGEWIGSITNSWATGNVIGTSTDWSGGWVGGLVGSEINGSITNCYATGNVTGAHRVGGLAGESDSTINSWASGNVSGGYFVGGLAGLASGTIKNSYATGNVTGVTGVGGLVGVVVHGTVDNSYALGTVTASSYTGGLAGWLDYASISNSYAMGRVNGPTDSSGGLVGGTLGNNSVTGSYWNVDSTGQRNGVGLPENGYTTTLSDTQGLTSEQWKDLQYYRNGTIDQVLANRTVAAARQDAYEADARGEAGGTMGRTLQYQAESPELGIAVAGEFTSLDDRIVFADSDSYGAHIKAISAEGVQFDLEGDSDGKEEKK
ncbi:MAG: Heme/hemopexin-binding protein precursor [Syntrophorhabdus sp. PtaB.Bin006]|nr:MAG: Heme/hemopexin-binding protein precursor [Syntrophorhabdus sp. PtaB.Bin006]